MSDRTRSRVAVGAVVAVLVGGCGAPPPQAGSVAASGAAPSVSALPGPAALAPLPGSGGSGLVSTGWRLVGVPRTEGVASSAWLKGPSAMVPDGAGHVWIRSGWQVIRLDVSSGESRSWDAGDDAVFASPWLTMAPAAGSGVWLLDGDRIRLFDGEQFAVDLHVPDDVLDVTDGRGLIQGSVEDVVERGSELWLSIHAERISDTGGEECGGRVVRWANGRWTQMSMVADGASGDLALDSEGNVWAGGRIANPAAYEQGVRRWDGARWALPDAGGAGAPTNAVGSVASDRAGGLWFLEWGDGGRLYRFDGTAWRSWSAVDGNMALAVAGDGDALLTRSDSGGALTRISVDGLRQVVGPERGLGGGVGDVEVASGDEILMVGRQGVARLTGDRLTLIWRDSVTPFFGILVAASEDEVWALDAGGARTFRHDGADWHGIGPTATCPAVLATDGAMWVATEAGLVRYLAGRPVVVATGIDRCQRLFAGSAGSVWLTGDSEVVRYASDGGRTAIPRPGGTGRECLKAAGADGSVWASAETDPGEPGCDDPFALARWDGRRWTPVAAPPIPSLGPLVVTDDGAAWSTSWSTLFPLIRYHGGRWTAVPGGRLSFLTAVRGGRVCGMEQADPNSSYGDAIVCYDPEGEVARIDLHGMGVTNFSVAPDGVVWVLGDQVARLDETLPMG